MNDFEIPNQVLITTERLVLREFTLMDAAAVFAYSTKAEAHEFAEHPPHVSIYDTEEMLQHFLEWQFSTPRRNLVLAIPLKSNTRQVQQPVNDIAAEFLRPRCPPFRRLLQGVGHANETLAM